MSFNKITIVGNLGRDPELRYTPQGNAVCNFSVATNEKRRDRNGEMQDVTTWFRITLWGKQAENASKYLTKGSPVYVEGRLKVEEWTDRDGKGRYTLEVNATDMQFISGGGRGDEMSGGGGGGAYETGFGGDDAGGGDMPRGSAAPTDDDIPF
ncbi:MAG: single-stranded DNA-binding protein [Acidobacteriota bacterium]|nr:single-stranded DNA-binding protein [Acidobacteriota bacterium]